MATTRKRPLVVVVDDDTSIREAIESLLRSSGFSVASFRNGEACLRSRRVVRASFLVLDVGLPGMSGLHLHRELRKRDIRATTVLLTGDAGLRDQEQPAADDGVIRLLRKPFDCDELLTLLKSASARG